MAFDEDGDITSSKSDLICLERIMEYEKVDYGRPSQDLEDKLAILKIYNITQLLKTSFLFLNLEYLVSVY